MTEKKSMHEDLREGMSKNKWAKTRRRLKMMGIDPFQPLTGHERGAIKRKLNKR